MFHSLFNDSGFDEFIGGDLRRISGMMDSMNSVVPMHPMFGGDMFGIAGGMSLMPFTAPRGNDLMQMMNQGMGQFGAFSGGMGQCYSSSTVMTMGSGPDGKPQVYRESSSVVAGPGGIRETKKSVQDSRTGTKKMSIGHYIGERGHVKEREHNMYSGDQEENEEFLNLEEDEAESFSKEFEQKANNRFRHGGGTGYGGRGNVPAIGYHARPSVHEYPALPAPSSNAGHQRKHKDSKYHPTYLHSPHYGSMLAGGYSTQGKKKPHHSKPYLKKKKSSRA